MVKYLKSNKECFSFVSKGSVAGSLISLSQRHSSRASKWNDGLRKGYILVFGHESKTNFTDTP